MRNRFDQLAKNILRDALLHVGAVETQAEVVAEVQAIDVWYVPDPVHVNAEMKLGMLAEIACEPCMIEPFHSALDLRELRDCLRKQLTWHHTLDLRARRESGEAPFPALWILCAGRPAGVLESFRLAAVGAGSGVYAAAPGLRLNIVVLAELPRARGTVLLRLMGAGSTLRTAIADLMALPADAWERSIAEPWLVRLRFEVPTEASSRSLEEEELIVEIQKWYEEIKQGIRQEGRQEGKLEGRQEGKLEVHSRLFAKRLGRPLVPTELDTLSERLGRLGEDRLGDVVLTLDGVALAAWLQDPAAS